jgi:hypothetical protein
MPTKDTLLIRIRTAAYEHLKKVSQAYSDRGEFRSKTMLATEAILQIPVPVNGNGANATEVPVQEEAATPSLP